MIEFTNSEGEVIKIEDARLRGVPVKCLVLYDDMPPNGTGQPAPILLDEGLRKWLLEVLPQIDIT